MIKFIYDDGGRKKAGYKGTTGDCVVRAISIATEKDYKKVYKDLTKLQGSTVRQGVYRKYYDKYLKSIGWSWKPTMLIGSGCKVHLNPKELPKGRIIVRLSKHVAAVVNGNLRDIYDCSREGTRCVYGYYFKE